MHCPVHCVAGGRGGDGRAKAARLRLCRLTLWPNFDGFGFTLTAERTRQGLYIGNVEDRSPAKAGGLEPEDRIIEVIHQSSTCPWNCDVT